MVNQAADPHFVGGIDVVVVGDPLLLVIGVAFDGERDREAVAVQPVAGVLGGQPRQPSRRLDGIVALDAKHGRAAARG